MPDFFFKKSYFLRESVRPYQGVDSDAEVVLEENGPQGLTDGNLKKKPQYLVFFIKINV